MFSLWASAHRGKWGQLTPWKIGWKIKKRKRAKKSSFLNILRAIRAGRCRERRYADHIFIQIYFSVHHFVVKFLKIFFASGGKGALTHLTKILRTAWFSWILFPDVLIIITNQPETIVSRPFYRSTCVSRQLQLRTGGFCWCKVLLPTCPCWRQPAHSD